jgi:elongation factor P
MGTIDTSEFRKKAKIIFEGQPWIIVENDFVKPGKGQAFNRTKIKNLLTGRVLDKTFKSGESFEEADISTVSMQYLYSDGTRYSFMNTQNYEQIEISGEVMDDAKDWILENAVCEVMFWGEKVIGVVPPTFVDLIVTYTEPAVRGDTANNVTKKAKLETGAEVNVPFFIESGMKLKIDTRTGEYLQRST